MSIEPLCVIFIVGTSHEAYQIRPQDGPQDGADAFTQHVLQLVRTHACATIAEEMSVEPLRGRSTVGYEVAEEENLFHIFCDPTCSERQALGISKDHTPLNAEKREKEWLRRMRSCIYPVLFVCGANHVCSFAERCRYEGLAPTIATYNFEASEIPLARRIF